MREFKLKIALEDLGVPWEKTEEVIDLAYEHLPVIPENQKERVEEIIKSGERELKVLDKVLDELFEAAEERDDEDELIRLGKIANIYDSLKSDFDEIGSIHEI